MAGPCNGRTHYARRDSVSSEVVIAVPAQFLEIFGFLSVLLRGITLASNSLMLGGVAFLFLVRPGGAAQASSQRLVVWAAAAVTAFGLLYLWTNSTVLAATTGLRL